MNNAQPNEAIERYPLRSLTPVLRGFRPPAGAFDAAGSWREVFGVFTLAGRAAAARRVGELRFERRVRSDGEAVLNVAYEKRLTGGSQKLTAALHSRAGERLATPSRWTFETRLLDAGGREIAGTRLKRSATVDDGTITVRDAVATRTLRPAGAYTVNWSLFDAVQRLPRRPGRPIDFTLIDHFDQPKGRQTLAFRKAMDVAVAGGRTVRTFSFDLLGDGNVPWVYWVDEQGRLLFIVAGLEGYVLESCRQA